MNKQPIQIISLIAEKRHGKDTTADQLIHADPSWQRLSFGNPIYEEVAEAFGLEDEFILRNDATKDRACEEMALKNCADAVFVRIALSLIDAHEVDDEVGRDTLMAVPLSPRQILQWWGGEYRRAQDPLYWIKKAEHHFKPGARLICTDVRDDTEVELIKKHNGLFVHVYRPGRVMPSSTHKSDLNIQRYIKMCSYKIENKEHDIMGLRARIAEIAATFANPFASFVTNIADVPNRMLSEKQLETAALSYCRLRGIDPYEKVQHSPEPNANGYVQDVVLISPRWKLVSARIREHVLIEQALEYARAYR